MQNTIIINDQEIDGELLEWLMQQNLPLLHHTITSQYLSTVMDNGATTALLTPAQTKSIYVLLQFLNHLQQEKQTTLHPPKE